MLYDIIYEYENRLKNRANYISQIVIPRVMQ